LLQTCASVHEGAITIESTGKRREVVAVGAKPAAFPIYKSLAFAIGSMSHFALFRQDLETSTISGGRIRPSQKLGAGLNLLTQESELGTDAGLGDSLT